MVAAHAALRKPDATGGYQTETGWANGDRFVRKGNWGTYFSTDLNCDCDSGGGGMTTACETAFAFGDTELEDICVGGGTVEQYPGCPTITQKRWGWQIGPVFVNTTSSAIMWAGAGQNDVSKAEHVGVVSYIYTQTGTTCRVEVTFDTLQGESQMAPAGWFMNATHLYASYEMTQTVAPGQFGHGHDQLDGVMVDTYTVSWEDQDGCAPVYLVAHAEACYDQANGDSGDGSDGSDPGEGGSDEEPGGGSTPDA
ncbi:MAG: hypothetical protein ETSY1_34805 [Candidatus Entotheonella factor]|uniref:Uncharacterized protein n=1 Tax=Entotheonella factor TaxID=1429438 RepID=W4L8P3_ENTF1|nr:MAG: hypothetical protein ETSY1_34805 [Candidatus Entotheonella factor]